MLWTPPFARGAQGSGTCDCKDIIDNINFIINIMKVKTKEYEVPKVDVLRMCTQEILCASSQSGGGSNESIVDDSENGTSSWDWIY